MGIVQAIRGLGPVAGPGEPGLNNAKPKSDEPTFRPANTTGAQTPEEALAFIKLLYKSGRMEDMAGLLRQHKVFREAWLILQQSFPAGGEASGGINASIGRRGTPGYDNFPVPYPMIVWNGPELKTEKGSAKQLEVASEPGLSFTSELRPLVDNRPPPSCQPTYLLTRALQVYVSQLQYFAQEKAPALRINITV